MNDGEICVAHLVRRANDVAVFKAFMESYRRCPAGTPHDLLLIFKGFARRADFAPYEALIDGLPHKRTFLSDRGYDVRPYIRVAHDYHYRYFLFLNSFSCLLAPGWLEMFYRNARRPRVGLVGATGSYQSILSDYQIFKSETRRTGIAYRWALMGYRAVRYVLEIRGQFPPFPNYHVRTNAFMIRRDLMTGLRAERVLRKWNAYRFESGFDSMTHQIMSAGHLALIVGADSRGYEPPEWPEARTFWIGRQENLLVSDNQTRAYELGSQALRERLSFHAWRTHPDGRRRLDVPVRVWR